MVPSTGGIAQFTHSRSVTAGSSVAVSVRFDQADDILKILTVFDRAGAIGPASLPGKAALAELFRDLAFRPAPSTVAGAAQRAVGRKVEIAGPVNAKRRVFREASGLLALARCETLNFGRSGVSRATRMAPAH